MTTPWSQKPKPVKPKAPEPPTDDNPNSQTTRTWGRKGRVSPRHSNTVRRVLRIAQAAWEGRSASEISDEIGVGTQYVYQLCSDYRITLSRKSRAEYSFRVTIPLKALARLEKIAAQRDEPLHDILTRAIDALSNEPVLLANLIEEIEEEDDPAPPRRRRSKKSETVVDDDPETED